MFLVISTDSGALERRVKNSSLITIVDYSQVAILLSLFKPNARSGFEQRTVDDNTEGKKKPGVKVFSLT